MKHCLGIVSKEEEEDDDDEQEQDEQQHIQNVGRCQLTIVGIRYYNGTVHPGEYVNLHREPNNPYDRMAIRVDNMRDQKVRGKGGNVVVVVAVVVRFLFLNLKSSFGVLRTFLLLLSHNTCCTPLFAFCNQNNTAGRAYKTRTSSTAGTAYG